MTMKNNKNIYFVFLSVLLGGVGALSFPPYNLFFFGLISYGSLFLISHYSQSIKQALLLSFFWGIGFHVSGLWWIAEALLVDGNPYRWAYPLAVLGLPALLSIFVVITALIYRRIVQNREMSVMCSALLFAVLFSGAEWLRGNILTGFPWNLPAYIWSEQLEVLQALRVFGAYGLSALTLILSMLLGALVIERTRKTFIGVGTITLLFVVITLLGYQRLENAPTYVPSPDLFIRIVQPNIAQSQKWDPDKYIDHLYQFRDISILNIPEGEQKTALLIFPETALNDVMMSTVEARDALNNIVKAYENKGMELFILTGALRSHINNENREYYNSALLYDKEGYIVDDYDKSHLVPFGEYIPFSNIINIAPIVQFSGFQSGSGAKSLHHKSLPSIAVAICYEIIFPKKLFSKEDKPELIVTITNDAWYGDTAGPYQHYMMARYRAIEEQLPVLRSANTGISGGFDPFGRAFPSLKINESGYIDIVSSEN